MRFRYASIAAGFLLCGVTGVAVAMIPAAYAAEPAKPAITDEASAAIQQMGKSLSVTDFSFDARTIRVYPDNNGRHLHIFHTMHAVVRRPDRLAVHVKGDDGNTALLYDGKTAAVVGLDGQKYALISSPNNIDAMMRYVMGRLQVDFPLADFLTEAPDKAFLVGVTSGGEVNIVTIDGEPYRHLFFLQKGEIELELWLERNERALPRRLIVTYRSLPGQPNFIAELSNWTFSGHPSDEEFVFRPPAGAKEVSLGSAPAENGQKGGK
jgi:hypothetical protein